MQTHQDLWDWSKAGDKNRKPKKDKYGMGDYHWKKGEFIWKESAKPVYRWYGGFMKRVLFLGDKLDMDAEWINITEPVGSINDPNSKISPVQDHGRRSGRGRRVQLPAGAPPVPQTRRQDRLLEAPRLAESLRPTGMKAPA
jgi:hypothetical protein